MLGIGTNVLCSDENVLVEGTVVDYYRFKTEKYYEKYNYALLIKCKNGRYILKLESDIKTLNEQ